jgi:membrane protease YdiL (CAAX protease family)
MLNDYITVENLACGAGILLFGAWLLRTSLGRNALSDCPSRRNNMPFYLPFVPLFVWLVGVSLAVSLTRKLLGAPKGWQGAFADNLVLGIGAVVTIVVIVFLARASFARRLKGFGLNLRRIHRDFFAAPALLLAVWPLLLAAIILTTYLGRLIWGPQYQIEQHTQLELIQGYSQLPLRILVVVVATVCAPLLEEMLFRGLFQTMVRSYLAGLTFRVPVFAGISPAWQAIAISSIVFAMAHENPAHWPALLLLGTCLGYAYEKTGSLFRPIFIHALFNALTITAVLYG